jgi:predicted RNase H-like HicB family nuclease
MKGLLRLEFRLPANVKKKGRIFVAQCPLLDVYTQGATRAEAFENLREAIKLFLQSCLERGTLEQVLRDSGFESAADTGALPGGKQDYVDVPLSLIASRKHAEARTH